MLEYAYCDCCQRVEFIFNIYEIPDSYDELLDTVAMSLISYMKDNNVNYEQVRLDSINVVDKKVDIVFAVDLRINGQADSDLDEDLQTFYSTTDFGIPNIKTNAYSSDYLGSAENIDYSSMKINVDDIEYGEEYVFDGSGDVLDDDFDPYIY